MPWKVNQVDENKARNIMEVLNIQYPVAKLLVSRGYDDPIKADAFLNPTWENSCHDPYLLKGINKACDRIITAVQNNELIIIYGDYDADGITATALLYNFFRIYTYYTKKEVNIQYILPDRLEDGYGLNPEQVIKWKEIGASVIITVDNGISAHNSAQAAKTHGIDLIITDHHSIPESLPEAYSIINPKQPECSYPFKELTGVAIAYKLALVLGKKLLSDDLLQRFKLRFLDLVAIGTYQDVAPLYGENRFLVMQGLHTIRSYMNDEEKTNITGIKELINVAGYSNAQINDYILGFVLGPRINAGGRIDTPDTALKLLTASNSQDSKMLAHELNEINKKRQNMKTKAVSDAIRMIEMRKMCNDPLIIISSETWHKGIIGLIAGDIVRQYDKPVIVLSSMGDKENYTASCRSIEGFHITDAITTQKELLLKFGGHEKAAGFSISKSNLDNFKKNLIQYAEEYFLNSPLKRKINIDIEIELPQLNPDVYNELFKFAPFGEGNPTPVFGIRNVEISSIYKSQRGLDTNFSFRQKGKLLRITAFKNTNPLKEFRAGDTANLIVTAKPKMNMQSRLDFQFVDLISNQ